MKSTKPESDSGDEFLIAMILARRTPRVSPSDLDGQPVREYSERQVVGMLRELAAELSPKGPA